MRPYRFAPILYLSICLFSNSIIASDTSKVDALPSINPQVYNWSGFYGGFNMGAVNHTMKITDTEATTFQATIEQVSNPQFSGGFQIGYRRQLDLTKTSGVFGAEFSTNFSDASFKKEYGSSFALYDLSTNNALKTLCLLQLVGGVAADKTFLFITAGLSWMNLTGQVTSLDGIPFFNSLNLNKNELGTSLGGGIEYAYSDKISARLKVDWITPNTYSTSDNLGDSFQISNSVVQALFGVNYKLS